MDYLSWQPEWFETEAHIISRADFKMAACLFSFFEEIIANDLSVNELCERSDEEIVLLLLVGSECREEHIWTKNYYEVTIPNYNHQDFRSHFRMSKRTITVIENLLAVHDDLPQYNDHGGRPPVELRKQILLSLWVLGNPECLRSAGCRSIWCL